MLDGMVFLRLYCWMECIELRRWYVDSRQMLDGRFLFQEQEGIPTLMGEAAQQLLRAQ